MGGAVCNYSKDFQNIPTSTNLPIVNVNNKSNKKRTYKYYSNLKTTTKALYDLFQNQDNTKNQNNLINTNEEIFKSKNNRSFDMNIIETNEFSFSHINNNTINELNEPEQEKIETNIITKFDNEIKQFAEYISLEKFDSAYNIEPSIKQFEEYIDGNFFDDIKNKKFNETFSRPPLFFKKDKSIYKGSFNFKGKKEGFGILIDSLGNKYIGEWKNDFFDGKGILLSINGDFYYGDFISGKIEGFGIYISSQHKYFYSGEFVNNKFNGIGKIIYEENDIYKYYEGNFSEGYMNGEGNLIFSDNSSYKGNFDKNCFEGNGIFYFANARKYNGNWKKNNMDGIGEFIWEDGTKYKGQYKNNIREGDGVYSFGANLYDGVWVDNLPHGKGILLNEGLRIEGIFRYGKIVEIINSKGANKEVIKKFNLTCINDTLNKKFKSQNCLPKFQTDLFPKKIEKKQRNSESHSKNKKMKFHSKNKKDKKKKK